MTAALGRVALVLTLASFAFVGAAYGQTYEAGLRAYEEGRYDRAYEVWRPLAQSGDPVAQYSLGKLYERGGGAIGQNFGQAARWYGVAARQGIAAAQNNLALMYAQGRGVDRNVSGAIELWLSAARQNHPMAQYNLGLAYFRGEGVAKDEREAAGWFRRAADAGLGDAQYAMGQMNRLGLILPKDQGKALAWYKMASEQGHREAKAQVQLLEAAGLKPTEPGVPQIIPTGLASDSPTALPRARTSAAALETLAEPDEEVAAASPQVAPQAAPRETENQASIVTAAGQGATAQPAAGGEPRLAGAPAAAVPQPSAAEATGPDAATPVLRQAETVSPSTSTGVPLPRQKPAVPRLAMQPQAPSPYPDEALAAGAGQFPESAQQPAAEQQASAPRTASPSAAVGTSDVPQGASGGASEGGPSAATGETATQTAAVPTEAAGGTAAPGNAPAETTAPRGNGRIQVWLASEKSADAALELWPATQSRFPDLLAKAQPGVTKVTVGEGGTFYRLMAGPLKSREAARDLCALMRLQDEDAFCKVLRN